MKNLEQLKKDFESLSEQEKDTIKNLEKLEEKDFEKVVGGLSTPAKKILFGLGIAAVIGGGGTALYKLGESKGEKEGFGKGAQFVVNAKVTLESLANNFKRITSPTSEQKKQYRDAVNETLDQINDKLGKDFIPYLNQLTSMLKDQGALLRGQQ